MGQRIRPRANLFVARLRQRVGDHAEFGRTARPRNANYAFFFHGSPAAVRMYVPAGALSNTFGAPTRAMSSAVTGSCGVEFCLAICSYTALRLAFTSATSACTSALGFADTAAT